MDWVRMPLRLVGVLLICVNGASATVTVKGDEVALLTDALNVSVTLTVMPA
jgi:aspartate 1-decarboxylase